MLSLGLALRQSEGAADVAPFSPLAYAPIAAYEIAPAHLWADTAGTTPAVPDGPVARIDDQSGNSLHLIQATVAAQPTLRTAGGKYWIEFDGSSDGLATVGNLAFGGSTAASYFICERHDASGASAEIVLETGVGTSARIALLLAATTGAFTPRITSGNDAGASYSAAGMAALDVWQNAAASLDAALVGAARNQAYKDGYAVTMTDAASVATSTGPVDAPLNIGARSNAASFWFDGDLAGWLVILNRTITPGEALSVAALNATYLP